MAKRFSHLHRQRNPFEMVSMHEDRLHVPLHWSKPRMCFVCSLGDLFHADVPEEFIYRVFRIIRRAETHRFVILTKRQYRMLDYMQERTKNAHRIAGSFPPRNLWLGVSVENQAMADERIPLLLQAPAAVRFVSLEPLIGPADIWDYCTLPHTPDCKAGWNCETKLDWIIVGCESGPRRRPCNLEWVKSVVDQCDAAQVPVFVKQLDIGGKVSHDPAEWPEWARRQEWPNQSYCD